MKALLLVFSLILASAGVLDRVRSEGLVHCGAEQRAGFALTDGDGQAGGLAVELCRAVAVAVLGPQARVALRVYDSDASFEAAGADDVSFLTSEAIGSHHLAAALVPGPMVFVDQLDLMVPEGSAARDLADLAGAVVCFTIGGPAQRALEQDAERLHLAFARLGFEEEVEMLDAYNVGRCQALAGEATWLAAARSMPGVNGLRSRILGRSLGSVPIMAATPATDGGWAALVGWILRALIQADRPGSAWATSGADSFPFTPADLGLNADWLEQVRAAVGSYRAMYERTLVTPPSVRQPGSP